MMLLRVIVIPLSMLLVLLAAGCDDGDDEGAVNVEATPRVPGIRAPDVDKRIEEVVIQPDGIEPRQLNMTAAADAEVQVANRSDAACTFFIGEYLQGLQVPPGETAKMGLSIPVDRSDATVPMGCLGDPDRQGSAVIEFKGVLPGPGR